MLINFYAPRFKKKKQKLVEQKFDKVLGNLRFPSFVPIKREKTFTRYEKVKVIVEKKKIQFELNFRITRYTGSL